MPDDSKQALRRLRDANERAMSRRMTNQRPRERATAVVFSCSECNPALVFDLPRSELVIIQTPGHAIEGGTLPSIVLALSGRSPALVLVLGHTECDVLSRALRLEGPSEGVEGLYARLLAPGVVSETALAELNARRVARQLRAALESTFDDWDGPLHVTSAVLESRTGNVRFHESEDER
jgi:carbonic anhydrase